MEDFNIKKLTEVKDVEDYLSNISEFIQGLNIIEDDRRKLYQMFHEKFDEVYDKSLGCLALREVYDDEDNKYGYVIKIESRVRDWIDDYLDDNDLGVYFRGFNYEYKGINKILGQNMDYNIYLVFKDAKGTEFRLGLEGFKFKGFNRREYDLFLKGFLGGQ